MWSIRSNHSIFSSNCSLLKDKNKNILPIFKYKDEILEKIEKNQVVIITGETGCGKTTKVPQFILEDAKSKNQRVNILISQPRKIAAMSIARRVSSELNTTVGELVGYQVGLSKKLNYADKNRENTQLLFCTTGVILQKLIMTKSMEAYTHIILDEIHERDIDTDFLMTILREFLLDNNCDTRLILMSATLNAQKFARYFKLGDFIPPVIAMQIKRPFKIDILYLDDPSIPKFDEDIVNYQENISITSEMYRVVGQIVINHLQESDKSILVFLPGVFEIECMHAALIKLEDIKKKCVISILHAQLPVDEQKDVFIKSDLPRVILSTNVAENSITLPDLGAVVDLCLAKFMSIDPCSTMARLKIGWISKQSCQQRAGRTGRMCNGKVYRMVPRRFFNDFLNDEIIPEILRAPLETTILRIKMLERDDDSPVTFLNKCMDAPKHQSVLNSIMILKECGGLQIYDAYGNVEHSDGDLTFIGRVMASLPIDVRLSKLIIMGYIFNVLDDAIIIASALNLHSIFKNRYNKKMEDYKIKLKLANGTGCDALTMLNAYQRWLNKKRRGDFRDLESEDKWCHENCLERKNLNEMLQLIREINSRIADLKLEKNPIDLPKHEISFILKVCLAAALYPNYFILGRSDFEVERNVYKGLLGLDPNRTVYFRKMDINQIGEVYVEQIKEKLVKIGYLENTDGLKFSFDTSKIFMEFPDSGAIDYEFSEEGKNFVVPGKISTKIYEGVKLRNLILARENMQRPRYHNKASTIQLNVLPSGQTREYAVQLGCATVIDYRFKLNKPTYYCPEECVFPQFAQEEVNGRITHIEHCGNFFLQIQEGENNLLLAIDYHFKEENLVPATIRKNLVVVIKHDEKYCRGKIMKVYTDSHADCYFFDYGFTLKIPFENIFEVDQNSLKGAFSIPERGFSCKLSRLEPSTAKCPRGKWTEEVIDIFRELALDKECRAEIYSFINDVASVELYIEEININDYLVEKGYAVRCKESYASRLNHDEREGVQYSIKDQPTREMEFKDKINAMLVTEIPHPDKHMCTETIYLEGPMSPLETTVYGLVDNNSSMAKIDQFSVNSVQLDTCVENYDGQMILAANVIQNPPNESTLHGVTAMPNIRGLPALLMMMFAPKIVFECDTKFERIINVKSNVDFIKNEPIFPNHVCSAPVNFKLDSQDCMDINELRFIMSRLLVDDHYHTQIKMDVNETRDAILKSKELMMKILQRDRKELKPSVKMHDVIIADGNKIDRRNQFPSYAFNQVEFPIIIE